MKYIAIFFLILLSTPRSLAQSQTNCSMVNSYWTFKGFLYNSKGTLSPCPEEAIYVIHFKDNGKITGKATFEYWGKYKLKRNQRIKMRLHISKGVSDDSGGLDELYCRIDYGKYLARRKPVAYDLQEDELKIFSNEFVTMIFERIKK